MRLVPPFCSPSLILPQSAVLRRNAQKAGRVSPLPAFVRAESSLRRFPAPSPGVAEQAECACAAGIGATVKALRWNGAEESPVGYTSAGRSEVISV
jgi:hypothetical protein